MSILNAEKLTLGEVHRLLGFERSPLINYPVSLQLESLTEFEQQELSQIAVDFERYLLASRISEGLVKALTIFPLIRLAGFYQSPIELSVEEGIARIEIEDSEDTITGRFDVLDVNRTAFADEQPFWILVIESKNSAIDVLIALPQLLTYAYQSLAFQPSVWGLVTNGLNYQFVYLQQGNPCTYQLLSPLYLLDLEQASRLLQVLKAVRQLTLSTMDSAVA